MNLIYFQLFSLLLGLNLVDSRVVEYGVPRLNYGVNSADKIYEMVKAHGYEAGYSIVSASDFSNGGGSSSSNSQEIDSGEDSDDASNSMGVPSSPSTSPDIPGIPDIQSALTSLAKAFSPESEPILSRAFAPGSSPPEKVSNEKLQESIMVLGRYFESKNSPSGGDIPGIPELQTALMTLSSALNDKEKQPILANIFNRVAGGLKSIDSSPSQGLEAAESSAIISITEGTPTGLYGPPSSSSASTDGGSPSGVYGPPPPPSSVSIEGGYPVGPSSSLPVGVGGNPLSALPAPGNPLSALGGAGGGPVGALKQIFDLILTGVGTATKVGGAGAGVAGAVGESAVKQVGIIFKTAGAVGAALGTGLSDTLENKGQALTRAGGVVKTVFV